MTDLVKEYLKKNGPTFGIISAIGGFVTDVLAPLANFALYLLIASLGGLLATAAYYYFANRDTKITQQESAMTKVVFFGFFAAIWGSLTIVHLVGPPNGVVAATVPGIEELQASIGIIEKDVKDIKADTEQILLELRDLKSDLENAQNGTITEQPSTAEEWYTNAILYASQGDNEKSISAYEEFFSYGYPYLDAYQNFNVIARNEISKSALQKFYRNLASDQPNNVLAQLMMHATEKDTQKRRSGYDDVRRIYGDSSILLYWMINEYSAIGTYLHSNELSATETQQWTTADQATLKTLIEDYKNLPPGDDISLYFINSFAADGAKTLINSFSKQFEDETVNTMLENPLVLVTYPTGEGNEQSISFIIYDSYTDIQYRIPGYIDEFTSTIPTNVESSGPWGTTDPDPETEIRISLPPGEHTLEVFWKNLNNQPSNVYTFTNIQFLTLDEWFERSNDGPEWIYPDGSTLK